MSIEIMDTTLRDGEQTSGVSFVPTEKLNIAKMLLGELGVDRIEVASAKVSKGEFEGVKKIIEWANKEGMAEKVEILGFVDGKDSLNWINDAGGKTMNLLCKGSMAHVTGQLRKTPDEHIADIKAVLDNADEMGIEVNLYLEDWSSGMRNSPDYVFYLMDSLKNTTIKRFMLPDTLGILCPAEAFDYCKIMVAKYPGLWFDFHGHNDYGMGVSNTLAAVQAGFKGVHTTVNGLGERTGNAPLASVVAVLNDHTGIGLNVKEDKITAVSRLLESFTGIRVPANMPVVGENVFTQACGVHADGDSKAGLYFNSLLPERFGRVRKYALGKTSGKANIKKNLEELGIVLNDEGIQKVTERVVELSDQKEMVTADDLPYIISDVLHNHTATDKIALKNYSISNAMGLKPMATISMDIEGQVFEESSTGDGQYDAFMKAVRKVYGHLDKETAVLLDYVVNIPAGGRTDALVETAITWQYNGKEFKTHGLEPDQTDAAIKATMKMLNLIEDW